MNAAALSVTADSRLSDDVLMVSPLTVSPTATAGVSIDVAADGSLLLLAVLAGVGAVELRVDQASPSGYVPVPLPDGAGATEIVGCVDRQGACHAVYATPAAGLHTSRSPGGDWGAPTTLPVASGLAAAVSPLTPGLGVSGIDVNGDVVIYEQGWPTWTEAYADIGERLLGGWARVLPSSDNGWLIFGCGKPEPEYLFGFQGTDLPFTRSAGIVTVSDPVAKVLFACANADVEGAVVLFTDSQNALYWAENTGAVGEYDFGQPTKLPLGNVVQGAGALDSDGNVRFYGCDPDGTLWALCQVDWDGGAPVWAPLFPFDVDVTFVAAPTTSEAQVLAAVRADGSIDLLRQSDATQVWQRTPVRQAASAAAIRTPRYRTVLSVTDESGLPCTSTALTVTPSDLVALECAGQTVFASPSSPASFTTDLTGAVEFSQLAAGVDAVTFTVTGAGVDDVPAVVPHGYLQPLLAGTASVFNGTEFLPPVTASALQAAQVDGTPLAPNLSDADATAAANGINAAAGLMLLDSVPLHPAFALDLRTPGAMAFTAFDNPAALQAAPLGAPATLAGGFWDALGDFADEIWHAIKSGAITVVTVTVDAVNRLATLTVELAKDAQVQLKNLALDVAGAVPALIHGIFNSIGAAADRVLEWLKDLLHWPAIWATMEAFDGFLAAGLDGVSTWLGQSAVVAAGTFFAKLRSEVDANFDQVITKLGGRSLGPPGMPTSGPLYTHPGSEAQNRFLLTKVNANVPGSGALETLVSDLAETLLTQAQEALAKSQVGTDSQAAWSALEKFFTDLESTPRELGQVLVTDLLTVAKDVIDVVLDAMDALITIVLEVASDVVACLEKVLELPLPDVPVVSWMWDNVLRPEGSTEPMTIGKLACLVLAVPVTLGCLIAGKPPPFGPSDASGQLATASQENGLASAQEIGSFALIWIDMVNDIGSAASDDNPNVLLLFWNWLDVVANGVVQTLFWPVGPVGNTDWKWSAMTAGEAVTNATWIGYWAPIMFDALVVLMETNYLKLGQQPPAELTQVAQGMDSQLGWLLVASGVTGDVIQMAANPPTAEVTDLLEDFVGPLPWATQFLLNESLVEASDGATVVLQCGIDFAGDWDWSAG